MTETYITSGGAKLAVERYGRGNSSLLVVSHGIFAHRSLPELKCLAEFLSRRFDVLLFDCRGHGDSTGRFTFGLEEWDDLRQLARHYGADYEHVGGIGFSFGAFHTCLAAARDDCFDAVTLVAGPKSFGILDHFPFGRDFVDNMRLARTRSRRWTRLSYPLRRRMMPIQIVSRVNVPIHFVHGKRDWLIHYKQSVAMHARANEASTLSLLDDGLHAEYLIEQMPQTFLPLVDDWMAQRLLGA